MPDALDRLLTDTAPTILVLCRTGGQASSLRRRLATRGGAAGILVSTPDALAAAAWPGAEPVEVEPPDTALLRRIGQRPRLRGRARELAALLAVHASAGGALPDHATAKDLAALADQPWVQALAAPAVRLLRQVESRAGADRVGPTASLSFDAVYHLGFPEVTAADRSWWGVWSPDRPLPERSAWHAALLAALGARRLEEALATTPGALPAATVPDPAAAARLAVALLRAAGPEVGRLVLVPDSTTAARLIAAGRRNGLWFADQESGLFASHALADAVRQAGRWFATDAVDPIVSAAELGAVLTHPLIARRLPAAAQTDLDRTLRALQPDATDRDLRASRTTLQRAIQGARIARAPLSAWRSHLEDQAAEETLRPSARMRAAHLAVRLERLSACAAARPFGQPYAPGEGSEDEGVVLDDAPPDDLPAPGTIGALRRFLSDCGLRLYDDPIGSALRAALLAHKDEPATPERITALLNGRAESDRLQPGVEIMRVDDYDGRPTALLVLLGVHDKGLSARRAPDPFLSDEAMAALGEPAGETARAHALLQARRAAARSSQPIAIAAHTDSTGRIVSAPLELQLDERAGTAMLDAHGLSAADAARDSYGRSAPLPERERRETLVVTSFDGAPTDSPQDATVDHLRAQAHAEWCRHGRGQPRPIPNDDSADPANLADLLDVTGPLGPDELGLYLGELGPAPDGSWLPKEDRWSVSRHFTPLTNCLWRFLVERVLRVQEPEVITDELDPKEVGNSVHGAMERANPLEGGGIEWRVPEEALESAREDAVAQLRDLSREGFTSALSDLGHSDAAIDAATGGLQARWDRHWAAYAQSRIKSVEALCKSAQSHILAAIDGLPEVEPALQALEALSRADAKSGPRLNSWLDDKGAVEYTTKRRALRRWLIWAAGKALSGVKFDDLDKRTLCAGPGSSPKPIQAFDLPFRAFLVHETFTALENAARKPVAAVQQRLAVLHAPATTVEPELPFGRNAESQPDRRGADRLADATLTLGEHVLPVSGAIDRVLAVSADGHTLVELLDYKTGAATSASALRSKVASLELPQLPVYALVLQDLLSGDEPVGLLPAGSVVAAWAYDFVRSARDGGLVADQLLVADESESVRSALTRLVDRAARGSMPPIPLEDRERGASSWGYSRGTIALRDVSRFEQLDPQLHAAAEPHCDESGHGGEA